MRTENSKMQKFYPRSETCKNFTAQLPGVRKLHAFKVGKQNVMFFRDFRCDFRSKSKFRFSIEIWISHRKSRFPEILPEFFKNPFLKFPKKNIFSKMFFFATRKYFSVGSFYTPKFVSVGSNHWRRGQERARGIKRRKVPALTKFAKNRYTICQMCK